MIYHVMGWFDMLEIPDKRAKTTATIVEQTLLAEPLMFCRIVFGVDFSIKSMIVELNLNLIFF